MPHVVSNINLNVQQFKFQDSKYTLKGVASLDGLYQQEGVAPASASSQIRLRKKTYSESIPKHDAVKDQPKSESR
jgi:hypothetical protein